MPYYRVIVWLSYKHAPVQGIREVDISDIDVVYDHMWSKAKSSFGEVYVREVEVQMLAKMCRTVQQYIQGLQNKKGGKAVIIHIAMSPASTKQDINKNIDS